METAGLDKVVNVVEKSGADRVLENWRKGQAADGRRYPPEFLDDLLFKANMVVVAWIKMHKLPGQLSDLLDQAYCLRTETDKAMNGKLEDRDAEQIPYMVQDIIVDIIALGGNFYDENEDLKPGMPVDWKPDKSE